MVNPIRIKEYTFPQNVGNATTVQTYSTNSLNGEILRVTAFANFTGSVILQESGTSTSFTNFTVTSGTNLWQPQSFTNTTGSFVINGPVLLTVGSLASGTAVVFGPVTVLYR